ncbi:MAG TPA: lipopolysaccharide biosynthesis protein [Candidatus Hydrothermia bacterium]|nr:lipopolysaccharide biosynthesis protein [Candidatus Hydrothermia bacterium]
MKVQKERFYIKLLGKVFSFSLGNILNGIISIFTLPIITRIISPSEFGKASMFTLAYSLLFTLVKVGADESFLRFFHSTKEEERSTLFWSCIVPPFIILCTVAIPIILWSDTLSIFLFGTVNSSMIILLLACTATGVFLDFNIARVKLHQRGSLFSASLVSQSLVNFIVIILYAKIVRPSFECMVLGQISANIIGIFLTLIFDRSNLIPIRVNHNLFKTILKYGVPLMFGIVLSLLHMWVGRIILRGYSTFDEIGVYSIALRIISIFNIIVVGFQSFWVPYSFEIYENVPSQKKIFYYMSEIVTFVSVLIGLFIVVFKEAIIKILAPLYPQATELLPMLVIVPVLSTIGLVTERGINFEKKTYLFTIGYVISILLQVAIGISLVRHLHGKAIAISFAIAAIVKFVIHTYFSIKLTSYDFAIEKVEIGVGLFILNCVCNLLPLPYVTRVLFALISIYILFRIFRTDFREFIKQ